MGAVSTVQEPFHTRGAVSTVQEPFHTMVAVSTVQEPFHTRGAVSAVPGWCELCGAIPWCSVCLNPAGKGPVPVLTGLLVLQVPQAGQGQEVQVQDHSEEEDTEPRVQ